MTTLPTEPDGWYPDLDEEVYHAHPTSLSNSGIKTLLKNPARFRWEQDHPVYKAVFDYGSAAHRVVLGVGCELVTHAYDPAKVKSPKATTAWKTQHAEVRERGGVLLLPAERAKIDDMAEALQRDKRAGDLLQDGQAEVSAFALDPETGIIRRCRFDYLRDDVGVDYKTATSVHPRLFANDAASYGYYIQHPYYLDIAADLGHTAQGFVFIVQEKDPPYFVDVVEIEPDAVIRGRDMARRGLERFRDCTETGLWPSYRRDDRINRLTLPSWIYTDTEEYR